MLTICSADMLRVSSTERGPAATAALVLLGTRDVGLSGYRQLLTFTITYSRSSGSLTLDPAGRAALFRHQYQSLSNTNVQSLFPCTVCFDAFGAFGRLGKRS
jgi:hypothetical protein